jgi:hypothetical protein
LGPKLPFHLYPFCFFVLPNFLSKTSKAILNKSEESGHLCLIPDFRGNGFGFFPFNMVLSIDLSFIDCIILSYILSITSFFIFYHEDLFHFVLSFSCVY